MDYKLIAIILSSCLTLAIFAQGQTTTKTLLDAGCPPQNCTKTRIPEECASYVVFEHNGRTCRGCPTWSLRCLLKNTKEGPSQNASDTTTSANVTSTNPTSSSTRMEENWQPKTKSSWFFNLGFDTPNVDNIFDTTTVPTVQTSTLSLQQLMSDGANVQRNEIGSPLQTLQPAVMAPPRDSPTQANLNQPEVLKGAACPLLDCTSVQTHDPNCIEYPNMNVNGRVCPACPKLKTFCEENINTMEIAPPLFASPHDFLTADCPLLECPDLNLPQDCFESRSISINGRTCPACPVRSPSCAAISPDPQLPLNIPCPLLSCRTVNIPNGCEYIETYQFMGKTCNKCPIRKYGCNGEASEPPVCPFQRCPQINIPAGCRDVPIYDYMGMKCLGCPKIKASCNKKKKKKNINNKNNNNNNNKNNNNINKIISTDRSSTVTVACPTLACNRMYIPGECREIPTYKVQGRICKACPRWKRGCFLSGSKMPSKNLISDSEVIKTAIACPLHICKPSIIPPQCMEIPKFQFLGRTCEGCPRIKEGCIFSQTTIARCPEQMCKTAYIPDECKENTTFEFRGMNCTGCPRLREGCLAPPTIPEVACPLKRCPFINIPQGCRERVTYIWKGKICEDCPKGKSECNNIDNGPTNINTGMPTLNIACPLLNCGPDTIPVECREYPTIYVMGRQCSGCPTVRKGCNLLNDIVQSVNVSCPLQVCPLVFIPAECRKFPTFNVKGKICKGCPVEIPGCAETLSKANDSVLTDTLCPLQECQELYISPECTETQYFDYNGRLCEGCPTRRANCSDLVISPPLVRDIPQITCPLLRCSDEVIPIECIEYPKFEVQGRQCDGCPRRKQGCTTTTNTGGPLMEVICPLKGCPYIYIPPQCEEKTTFEYKGKICEGCPTRKPNCSNLILSPPLTMDIPKIACPLLRCSDEVIPIECREYPKFEVQGRQCDGCPRRQNGCTTTSNTGGPLMEVICPLKGCPYIYIPPQCEEKTTFEYKGKICEGCPTRKPNCSNLILSPPLTMDIPKIACPLLRCSDEVIPIECREYPKFEVQGRQCDGCPRRKMGCTTTSNTGGPLMEVICPLEGCPYIYIPPECEEKTTFEYNGKTCEGCPRFRKGCVPNPTHFDPYPVPTQLQTECPVQACPLIYIAPNCKESTTFDFNGKVCEGCPKMKPGCMPNACPLQACPMIYIPPECREDTIFDFNGKQCKGCPKWKTNCVAKPPSFETACPLQACPLINIPTECREVTTFRHDGKVCKGCPRWRQGCLPAPPPIETGCPLRACPKIYIPPKCRDVVLFDYKGKKCQGCPKWKPECTSDQALIVNGRTTQIECPIQICPLIEIPIECREIPRFSYNGKECFGCPKFKDSCQSNPGVAAIDTTLGQQENTVVSAACPLLNCPDVPVECQERQTFTVRGQKCEGCPTRRPNCITGTSGNNGLVIACPLLKCPLTPIPRECQEQTTIRVQRRNCTGCPTWKESCKKVFKAPWTLGTDSTTVKPSIRCPLKICTDYIHRDCRVKVTYEINGQICEDCPVRSNKTGCKKAVNTTKLTNSVDFATTTESRDLPCPSLSCPTLSISADCREETTLTVQGRVCKGCPKLREGCVSKACPIEECTNNTIPKECKIPQPYDYYGQICYLCPKQKENCPSATSLPPINEMLFSNPFLATMQAAQAKCPVLNCPQNNIPYRCQVFTTYRYRGITCPGCPIWRNGCATGINNGNIDGLLAYSLFSSFLTR